MKSEIAQMREKIEQECRSLQNMMRFSSVASHETIRRKYEALETNTKQLATLVGEKEATEIACTIYCEVVG